MTVVQPQSCYRNILSRVNFLIESILCDAVMLATSNIIKTEQHYKASAIHSSKWDAWQLPIFV